MLDRKLKNKARTFNMDWPGSAMDVII
jgi:hypothetical protein